jgi:hypothetical protein
VLWLCRAVPWCGVQETFGAMAKTEKIAFILEQVGLRWGLAVTWHWLSGSAVAAS